MCTYLCLSSSCLLFLWHILDHWLAQVVGPLLPSLSPHVQQGPSAGHAVLSQMPHPHCGVHWVVLVQLLTSYSSWLPSFLDGPPLVSEVQIEPW